MTLGRHKLKPLRRHAPMEKLTPGKLAGLKAVSDHRVVIAAAAMDQRGSLQTSLAKEPGAAADAHGLEVFKTLVTPIPTNHPPPILLHPHSDPPPSTPPHPN